MATRCVEQSSSGAVRGGSLSTEPVDNSVDYRSRLGQLFGPDCTFVSLVKKCTPSFSLILQWVTEMTSRRLGDIARNLLIYRSAPRPLCIKTLPSPLRGAGGIR